MSIRSRARHAVSLARRFRSRLRSRRRARWGNFRRQYPFSDRFGFDRGTPIDRVYIDRFFASHARDIHGSVLEVKDPSYSGRFGHDVVTLDLVDINPRNRDATVIADLAEAGSLPSSAYDCVLLPQTLQYVADPAAATANAWQSLRPGGVLLVTVPTVARVDPDLEDVDRWRFLPQGLRILLDRACEDGEVSIQVYGNLVTSMAFLAGLAAEELRERELNHVDARWPLVACGRAQRASP